MCANQNIPRAQVAAIGDSIADLPMLTWAGTSATRTGVRTALVADFDFGVPSLASIVEPIAAQVLTDVVQLVLVGLFGDQVEYLGGSGARFAGA